MPLRGLAGIREYPRLQILTNPGRPSIWHGDEIVRSSDAAALRKQFLGRRVQFRDGFGALLPANGDSSMFRRLSA